MVHLSDCDFLPFVQLCPLSVRDPGSHRPVDHVQDIAQRDGRQHGGRTRGVEGHSMVVEENRPLGDMVRHDYEPVVGGCVAGYYLKTEIPGCVALGVVP